MLTFDTLVSNADKQFQKVYGTTAARIIIRSPGRVNLIGEHTDHNEDVVLPEAIGNVMIFVIASREDRVYHFYAADLNEHSTCNLNALSKSHLGWPNYLIGVFDQFMKAGYDVRGCDIVFGGNVPIGAGMSSSAAIVRRACARAQ